MATGEDTGTSIPIHSFQDVVETLGITKDLSQKRIEVYKTVSANSTIFCRNYTRENIEVIIAGSRAEGTSAVSIDTDVDMLFVQRSVKCFNTASAHEWPNSLVSFLLDFEHVKSGYAMLRLIATGISRTEKQFLRNIRDGLVQYKGYKYLRNDRLFTCVLDYHREGVTRQPFVFEDTTGPARKIVCNAPFLEGLSVDRVLAFPVSYPSLLEPWCERERKYHWPSRELIEKVSSLDVFVVPVGVPGSVEEVLQWRISVTLAEQALVHSFNDTQIKLFAAVKMLVKHELKSVCDNMSSYVVKNVLFWVIEGTDAESFRKEFFDDRLLDILKYLRRCVYWKYLPNYMFPSRNMMDTKIVAKERRELIHKLDEMIGNHGNSALLRFPLVQDMIHMTKEDFQKKVIFRQLAEQAALAGFSIPSFHFEKLIKNNVLHKKLFHMKPEDIVQLVCKEAFPIIRRFNPFEYFHLLVSMTDREILYRLYEGILLDFL